MRPSRVAGAVGDVSRLVLVSGESVDDRQLGQMRAVAPGMVVERADLASSEGMELLHRAEVVAGSVPPGALAGAPRLRWNHVWHAGVDEELSAELAASPVVLTCSAGNGAIPLAEHSMLLMLILSRQAVRWIDAQRSAAWDRFRHGELAGSTLGIIGLGNIGTDLARKARTFHMRVIGLRQRAALDCPDVDQVYGSDELLAFLGECDFVVVTAPLTDRTRGMLGEAEFRAMRPSAYFINVARGAIADQVALLRALEEGWIAGAGLDAHVPEPLPASSPFWRLPNVVVTPHNGATTPGTVERGIAIFTENLARYAASHPLRNVVDKSTGYST